MMNLRILRRIIVAASIGLTSAWVPVMAQDSLINKSDSPLRLPLPERWLYVPDHLQTAPSEDKWWKEFGDSTLNMLISRAEANNFNVSIAMKRIELAEKEMEVTRAGYYPNLGVSAGWSGSQSSGASNSPVSSSMRSRRWAAGVNMSWEIDVFGKIKNRLKADKAAVDVSRAEYDAFLVSLCANVAKTYLQLRTYQMQYDVAREHIFSQEKVLKIAEARQEAGIGNMLDVTQAKIVLYSTKSSLPGLEAAIYSTANSIAVLTGIYPSEIVPVLLRPAELPHDMGMPALGVPVDLLRRRPDIVEAEAQLAQYAAQIGVAKNDFLPVLSLDGSIGTSARKLSNMFGSHSMDYSIAPTLSWTIFDGKARNANLAMAKIQFEEAADNYNLTVLNAIEEVENSIARYNGTLRECEYLEELIDQSRKSLDLSLGLYKQGLTAFSNVVDAQQSFLENQNSLVSARGDALSQLVALYQALGGGY
ncbi:MAG: efflux transporter outer membrane subunit [Muribaculaceae bacterium]|nr:efflux transporter outer membrane subunit [Muribaculaceae bacterium]